MGDALLLTGAPGCGKTTAIRGVVAKLERPAGGFFTQEIRVGGRRVGFRILTLDGEEGILAHVSIPGSPRVGKYGVNLESLNALGVESVRRAMEASKLTIVDEIGPMEILSPQFREVVRTLLELDVNVLGSITKKNHGFFGEVKAHPRVRLIEITPANRAGIAQRLMETLERSLAS
jgi:nucleoside-triphosphatase